MNTVTVKINGVEYNLRGKEDVRYLFDVAAYVDTKVREISDSNKKLSTSSAAVLTAVNIADELFKCDLDISDLNKKNNSIEEKNLSLKEEILDLKQSIDKINKEKSNEIEILNNVIKELKSKLEEDSATKDVCKDLSFKLESIENESKENLKTISQLNDDLNYFKNRNSELEALVSKYKSELENTVNKDLYNEVNSELENLNIKNNLLVEENNTLRELNSNLNNEVEDLAISNKELSNEKQQLNEKINVKEIELNNYVSSNKKQNLEEIKTLNSQISIMEKQLKDTLAQKETLKSRNKEIKFQMQNYKYKVLDLEKKLINAQFNLAVEKKDKNPLLR